MLELEGTLASGFVRWLSRVLGSVFYMAPNFTKCSYAQPVLFLNEAHQPYPVGCTMRAETPILDTLIGIKVRN